MAAINENQPHKDDTKASRADETGTRNFIETHDVTRVTRKATPGAGEEAADLSQATKTGGSHDNEDSSPESAAKDDTRGRPTHPA